MACSDLLHSSLLESGEVDQIRQGTWPLSLKDKITGSLDIDTSLCSQLLYLACDTPTDTAINPESFSQGLKECAANTSSLSEHLVEAIWSLSIEWENSNDQKFERLAQISKSLVSTGVIDQQLATERLESDFLERIEVIPSAVAFNRRYIRLNTSLNFKQSKFNLICEQGEGFSKLVALVQATLATVSPHQLSTDILQAAAKDNNLSVLQIIRTIGPLQSSIQNLLTDIKRLIGAFSIDPNRVLDVLIDCFMSGVRYFWAFYIALFDASVWCQSPENSQRIAQLLGWKLQFYIKGQASDYKYMDELTIVAALLISHGLIRISDMYLMLQPEVSAENDGAMKAEFGMWCSQQKKAQEEQTGGLLSMMGGLDDMAEGGDDSSKDAGSTNGLNNSEWANQHALLCAKLLALGDMTNGLLYLQKFPRMARVHQQLSDLVLRVVDAAIDPIYRQTDCVRAPAKQCIALKTPVTCESNSNDNNAWGLPNFATTAAHYSNANNMVCSLTPLIERPNEYFFYEQFWLLGPQKRLPEIRQVADIPNALAPWLNVAFQKLHQSSALLVKLIRLCRHGMSNSLGSESMWLGFLQAWILPAFSLSAPSSGLSNELWLVVSMLSIPMRYQIYESWDTILTSGKPLLPAAAGFGSPSINDDDGEALMSMSLDGALEMQEEAEEETAVSAYVEIEMSYSNIRRNVRSVMRRLSGDTVKLMGRQLCNLCHSSPTIALKIVLDQVCSYDNLVDSVVEAFRYLSPLDSDVLYFTILRILDDPGNKRVKEDGINAAHWLQSLSLFIAAYSHRHENPRLDVVLDLILKRTLCMVHTDTIPPVFELTILSDIIQKLASIDVMANATEEQVLALRGGYHLSNQAFTMVSPWAIPQDASVDHILVASSTYRLTKRMSLWLAGILSNHNQALSFVVAMCVHAEKVLKMTSLPLSNIQVIYDCEIERIFQLFHLLHKVLKPEKYCSLIPSPQTLVAKYGLDWGMAALWGRPNISRQLKDCLEQWIDDGEPMQVSITEQENDMEVDDGAIAQSDKPRVVTSLAFEVPLLPKEYVAHVTNALPASARDIGLSPEFVATFWSLTLYDISVPTERYKREMDIQRTLVKQTEMLTKHVHGRAKAEQLSHIRAKATQTIEDLEKDMVDQEKHVGRISRWLIAQKDYWFCMAHEQRKLVTQALLQHCILPRAVLSATDAIFCAELLWMMHYPLATNKYSLMIVYDNVFCESLSTLLATFTENEARNYARFLNVSLISLAPLHKSEAVYEEQAVNMRRGLTGFQQHSRYEKGYLPPKSTTANSTGNVKEGGDDSGRTKPGSASLSHGDFRTVMRKWQVNLTKAFISTLDSSRNDTVRNGIMALREMQGSFPVISQYGRRILDKVNKISQAKDDGDDDSATDTNKNLKVMAASYGAYLSMAKKSWIHESEYYPIPPKPKAKQQHQQSNKDSQQEKISSQDNGSKENKNARSLLRSSRRTTESSSNIEAEMAAAAIAAAAIGSLATDSPPKTPVSEVSATEGTAAADKGGREQQDGGRRHRGDRNRRDRNRRDRHTDTGASVRNEPASNSQSAATTPKLTNEDVDRKRKELRAQLLKQQEEKQKLKQGDSGSSRKQRESRQSSREAIPRPRKGDSRSNVTDSRRGNKEGSKSDRPSTPIATTSSAQQSSSSYRHGQPRSDRGMRHQDPRRSRGSVSSRNQSPSPYNDSPQGARYGNNSSRRGPKRGRESLGNDSRDRNNSGKRHRK